jgi:hypothetical protein
LLLALRSELHNALEFLHAFIDALQLHVQRQLVVGLTVSAILLFALFIFFVFVISHIDQDGLLLHLFPLGLLLRCSHHFWRTEVAEQEIVVQLVLLRLIFFMIFLVFFLV